MPNVTVYIRKDDMDAWRQLPNKSEEISKLLRGQDSSLATEGTPGPVFYEETSTINPESLKGIKIAGATIDSTPVGKNPFYLKPKADKLCKNGHPIPDGRDRCMGKGCKYA